MTSIEVVGEYLTVVAGIFTSLGVIVGALYKWAWKPYIKKKLEDEKKHRQQIIEVMENVGQPFVDQLTSLEEQTKRHAEMDDKLSEIADQNIRIITEIREEFKDHNRGAEERDRLIRQNAEIIRNHEKRLDSHGDRILILETVTGLVQPTRQQNRKEDSNENK